jgi:hypothetical protein
MKQPKPHGASLMTNLFLLCGCPWGAVRRISGSRKMIHLE